MFATRIAAAGGAASRLRTVPPVGIRLWPTKRLACARDLATSKVAPPHNAVATAVSAPPDECHPPFARYAHAMSVPPDARLVVTSGQLGITPDGQIPDGVEAQTALCFANVDAILRAGGCSLRDVVRVNAYVVGREQLGGYMRARDQAIGHLPPVASTLMIVSGFARPEFLVEVEVMAAAPPTPTPPSGADGRSSAARVGEAAAGRRSLHGTTSARPRARPAARLRVRSLHGPRADAGAVAAFVQEVRAPAPLCAPAFTFTPSGRRAPLA
jgi:2-iminobutanoate/2-iminopropanoate deaminase